MSIWYDLLSNVGTTLEAVANIPPVIVREEPKGTIEDGLPVCVVTKGGPEEAVDYAFTDLVQYKYPVLVFLVFEQDRNWSFSAEDGINIDLRQTVRDALDKRTLSGASTVIDCDLEPLDLSGFGDEPNSPYKVTGFRCMYFSWETRT